MFSLRSTYYEKFYVATQTITKIVFCIQVNTNSSIEIAVLNFFCVRFFSFVFNVFIYSINFFVLFKNHWLRVFTSHITYDMHYILHTCTVHMY